MTLMEVDVRVLQEQAQVLSVIQPFLRDKAKDSALFYRFKQVWNVFNQKTVHFVYIF